MRDGFEHGHAPALARSAPAGRAAPAPASAREIPYDYVARFKLKGVVGSRVQDVINISVEGSFVAVAIGHSFVPGPPAPAATPILFSPLPAPPNATVAWLMDNLVTPVAGDPRQLLRGWLARACGIEFKYSIVDSGSGRELQNQPIHSLAGLGEATGQRPFRLLAKPMVFMPRSTIRLEIEELSEGPLYSSGELFIVLHGYKALGSGG